MWSASFSLMHCLPGCSTLVSCYIALAPGVERLPGDQGWRTSLGLAGLPAVILTLAAIVLPETPNSLAERGRMQEARRILEKIRGTDDVSAEMNDIIAAAEEAKEVGLPLGCRPDEYERNTCLSSTLA